MKVKEAVSLSQQKSALAGNSAARREVLKEARLLEERDRLRELEERAIDDRCYEGVVRWRAEQQRAWGDAADGTEPENP